MDPSREKERNTVPCKSKVDQLPWEQQSLKIREPLCALEREKIENFVEKLTTDVKFEVQFLKEMHNYRSIKNEYPFKSSRALEDFTKNWIGLNISEMEMLSQIDKLEEKYWKRAKEHDKDLFSLEGDEDQAFAFAVGIWGLDTENEYPDDEVEKNTNKKSPEVGLSIGQDQDCEVKWDLGTENEYADDEVGKNTDKESLKEGPTIGQDQDCKGIWGLDSENEYGDIEVGKNTNKESPEEVTSAWRGQDHNV